jgi:hypothetical protein
MNTISTHRRSHTNHRWKTITQGRSHYQQCERCGVIRKKHTIKTVMAIIQQPPYYLYSYKSIWIYTVNSQNTYTRPDCELQLKNFEYEHNCNQTA